MTTNSLAFRLFATAAAWTLLVLPIAGAIIYSLYRQEVETSFDRRLGVLLTVVLSDTIDHGDDEPGAPKDVGEPLFEVTHSGWYWQIKPLDGKPGHLLTSALAHRPRHPAAERARRRAQRARGALGQPRRPAGAEAARRRDHLRVRRGQEGAALLRCRRRHAGRGGDQPVQLPHPAHAGAGAGRHRPARRDAVPDPLRPACRCAKMEKGLAAIRSGEATRLDVDLPARDRAAAAGAQRAPQVQPGHRRARPHARRQPGARPEDAARRHHQRGARGSRARSRARWPSRPRSWPTRSISTSTAPAWRRASA